MYNMAEITTMYVSQREGNDRNQGFFPYPNTDMTGPLKTVEMALELIGDMRRCGCFQPVTIRIMDDIYYLEKPIEIPSSVSDVTLEPFSKTLLSGGIRVEHFKEDVFNGKKCVSADLSALGELSFTDFYVNGKRADFTRYPQEGTLKAADVENHSSNLYAHSKWFVAKKEDLEVIRKFRNFEDCFISYNHYWIDEHTPIEDYDMENGKITFLYPSRFTIELTHASSALEYIIENTAENFCNPNEWYYDRTAKKVYYIPAEDSVCAENLTAFIPVSDKIIRVVGTADKKAENIRIRNFDIAYTKEITEALPRVSMQWMKLSMMVMLRMYRQYAVHMEVWNLCMHHTAAWKIVICIAWERMRLWQRKEADICRLQEIKFPRLVREVSG